MNMFFTWSNGSCGTNKRDEAGTEQPVRGPADAGGCAERLDSICSSALSALKLGAGRARPKQRGGRWDEGKMIN